MNSFYGWSICCSSSSEVNHAELDFKLDELEWRSWDYVANVFELYSARHVPDSLLDQAALANVPNEIPLPFASARITVHPDRSCDFHNASSIATWEAAWRAVLSLKLYWAACRGQMCRWIGQMTFQTDVRWLQNAACKICTGVRQKQWIVRSPLTSLEHFLNNK